MEKLLIVGIRDRAFLSFARDPLVIALTLPSS